MAKYPAQETELAQSVLKTSQQSLDTGAREANFIDRLMLRDESFGTIATSVYHWLAYTIQENMRNSGARYVMKHHVQERLRDLRTSRRNTWSPFDEREFRALIAFDWNASQFLTQQCLDDAEDPLGKTITITGCPRSAQATTTEEYMKRVWPDSGTRILEILRQSLGKIEFLCE